ncbi:MAG: hypothetical protein QNK11_01760 [Legionella sp.]|nr:hypothetical protein [Legionella sp.]
MFWNQKQGQADASVAIYLDEQSYSLAVVDNNKQVVSSQYRTFKPGKDQALIKLLLDDVERLNLVAHSCQLILPPSQYQLILMDAPDVPDAEMAQALKWNLKGLSDYDLDDVAMDVFLVPAHNVRDSKKAVVALTLLSALKHKCNLFESVFLDITRVSIAEMALKNLIHLIQTIKPPEKDLPVILISQCNAVYTLHLIYQNQLHLIRTLELGLSTQSEAADKLSRLLTELERSIEYCTHQLNLPRPEQLFFTPDFHQIIPIFQGIEAELSLAVSIIDLTDYLNMSADLSLEEQANVFYGTIGALVFNQNEKTA